ncbi:CopG family ribbon-helix-helix protein [Stetteria hydrogenophila]
MSSKRRFGVSIGKDLTETLDAIAEKLNVSRSKIVERALQLFVEDHAHLVKPHECTGILLVACASTPENDRRGISVLEGFKDIITAQIHVHVKDYCIDLMVANGDSTRIAELYKKLESTHGNCKIRYIPLFID